MPHRRDAGAAIPPAPESLPDIVAADRSAPETRGHASRSSTPSCRTRRGCGILRRATTAGALQSSGSPRDLSPENPDFRYNYALTLPAARQRAAGGGASFERVVGAGPGRAGAYYNLAMAQLQLGDTAAAWTNLQRVQQLAADPAERAAPRLLRQIGRQPSGLTPPDSAAVLPPHPPPADTALARDTAAPRRARRPRARARP